MYTLWISRGIPLQIAKPDKQGETRAFRNGVQNIQITDGGQQYEIIQKSEDVDHEETQQGKLILYHTVSTVYSERKWGTSPSYQKVKFPIWVPNQTVQIEQVLHSRNFTYQHHRSF